MNIQEKPCSTCIYKKNTKFNLKKLEHEVRDKTDENMFVSFRICHHSNNACCKGFWNRHKDKFPAGQIAQRLNLVHFVNDDNLKDII